MTRDVWTLKKTLSWASIVFTPSANLYRTEYGNSWSTGHILRSGSNMLRWQSLLAICINVSTCGIVARLECTVPTGHWGSLGTTSYKKKRMHTLYTSSLDSSLSSLHKKVKVQRWTGELYCQEPLVRLSKESSEQLPKLLATLLRLESQRELFFTLTSSMKNSRW